jgi:hypothetical protein
MGRDSVRREPRARRRVTRRTAVSASAGVPPYRECDKGRPGRRRGRRARILSASAPWRLHGGRFDPCQRLVDQRSPSGRIGTLAELQPCRPRRGFALLGVTRALAAI